MGVRSAWIRISSFTRLLRTSMAAARRLDDDLVAEQGITIEEYEILSRIAHAPDGGLRQAGLSDPPLVTAANVERVLGELDRKRLVDRRVEGDVQVVSLTEDGRERVRSSHSVQLDELLGTRLASQ